MVRNQALCEENPSCFKAVYHIVADWLSGASQGNLLCACFSQASLVEAIYLEKYYVTKAPAYSLYKTIVVIHERKSRFQLKQTYGHITSGSQIRCAFP